MWIRDKERSDLLENKEGEVKGEGDTQTDRHTEPLNDGHHDVYIQMAKRQESICWGWKKGIPGPWPDGDGAVLCYVQCTFFTTVHY